MGWFNTTIVKVKYFGKYYRLVIHLLLHTQIWGVNNKWFSKPITRSIFGQSFIKQLFNIFLIYPIIINYRHMKWRMGNSVGFVPQDEYELLFNKYQ